MRKDRTRNQIKAVVLVNGAESFVQNVADCVYAQGYYGAWDGFYAKYPQPSWTYKLARAAVVFGF